LWIGTFATASPFTIRPPIDHDAAARPGRGAIAGGTTGSKGSPKITTGGCGSRPTAASIGSIRDSGAIDHFRHDAKESVEHRDDRTRGVLVTRDGAVWNRQHRRSARWDPQAGLRAASVRTPPAPSRWRACSCRAL